MYSFSYLKWVLWAYDQIVWIASTENVFYDYLLVQQEEGQLGIYIATFYFTNLLPTNKSYSNLLMPKIQLSHFQVKSSQVNIYFYSTFKTSVVKSAVWPETNKQTDKIYESQNHQ